MQKFTTTLSILFLAPALSWAEGFTANSHWAQEGSDLKPDPKAIYGGLDNGVRYIVLPNSEPPKRVSIRLHIGTGSLMENDDQQGLAHFMEHMAFNGTKNYPANEMV